MHTPEGGCLIHCHLQLSKISDAKIANLGDTYKGEVDLL